MRRAAMVSVVLSLAALAWTADSWAQAGTMQRILYGEVVSAEQGIVTQRPTGRGGQAGATVGAIAGYALADRGDRWIGSLLGGVLGGAAGHAAEKAARKRPGWQLVIRFDNGEEVGAQVAVKKRDRAKVVYRPGDRVRMMTGADGSTQVSVVGR